jgi:hypothetical protein
MVQQRPFVITGEVSIACSTGSSGRTFSKSFDLSIRRNAAEKTDQKQEVEISDLGERRLRYGRTGWQIERESGPHPDLPWDLLRVLTEARRFLHTL